MFTPDEADDYDPLTRPWLAAPTSLVFDVARFVTGARIDVEGTIPTDRPVLFATNSTQRHDFLPFRRAVRAAGADAVSIVKPKYLQDPVSRALLPRLGVVPLASRGFVLTRDFVAQLGRHPSDTEYRLLRDHLDHARPLPAGSAPALLAAEPHALFDRRFDPAHEPYAAFIRRVFEELQQDTLAILRRAVAAGRHIHVYPEGTVNERLGEGRTGAVQLAHALGLDIVPVGMSGARDVLGDRGLLPRGGRMRIRFGAPIAVRSLGIPVSHRAFVTTDEHVNRDALRDATARVMAGLESLLEPEFRRFEGVSAPRLAAAARFV